MGSSRAILHVHVLHVEQVERPLRARRGTVLRDAYLRPRLRHRHGQRTNRPRLCRDRRYLRRMVRSQPVAAEPSHGRVTRELPAQRDSLAKPRHATPLLKSRRDAALEPAPHPQAILRSSLSTLFKINGKLPPIARAPAAITESAHINVASRAPKPLMRCSLCRQKILRLRRKVRCTGRCSRE